MVERHRGLSSRPNAWPSLFTYKESISLAEMTLKNGNGENNLQGMSYRPTRTTDPRFLAFCSTVRGHI